MESNQLKLPSIHHAKDANFKTSNALSKSLDSLKSLETIADTETFYNNVKKSVYIIGQPLFNLNTLKKNFFFKAFKVKWTQIKSSIQNYTK